MKLLAVDTETTGLDLRHGCKPFMVTTCDPKGQCKIWEWPVQPETRQPIIKKSDVEEIKKYLTGKTLIFHHAKFDFRAFASIGIYFDFSNLDWSTYHPSSSRKKPDIIFCPDFHDTLLMSHALSSSDKHGLKELASKYLNFDMDDEEKLKKEVARCTTIAKRKCPSIKLGMNPTSKRETGYDYWIPRFACSNNDSCATYGIKDVQRTMLLYTFFLDLLKEEGGIYGYNREKKLLLVIYNIENDGITVNAEAIEGKIKKLSRMHLELSSRCKEHMKEILERESNPNSPKDLIEFYYDRYALVPFKYSKKGNPSTDKASLEHILRKTANHKTKKQKFINEFTAWLLESRSYKSAIAALKNYTCYAIPQEGIYRTLYPSLNQTGTATTRFSCSAPNGQNVSKINIITVGDEELPGPKIREVFGPTPDKIWYAIDYSQLELRVFAACSQEQSLIDALDAGYDFHGFVAQKIFNKSADQVSKQERRIAKNVNFALIFGASERKVNETAGISNAYALFADQFPNVHSYMAKMIEHAKEHRFVETLDGYRLDIPATAPYKAVNYIVQGTAGSIIKNAMIQIHEKLTVDWISSRIVLQIHDELIIEFKKDQPHKRILARIINTMENAGAVLGINTPVSFEKIDTNWGNGIELPRSYVLTRPRN